MIIDEDIVAGGVTPFIITKLIERHERERQRYRLLHDYYMGDHRILNRRKRGKNVANNRIMCNHAKYITDMTQSYLVGNPVTYAVSDDYDIEAIKNAYLEQDIPSEYLRQGVRVDICGRKQQAEKCTIGSGAYICMLLTVGI